MNTRLIHIIKPSIDRLINTKSSSILDLQTQFKFRRKWVGRLVILGIEIVSQGSPNRRRPITHRQSCNDVTNCTTKISTMELF